jgi:hypothetical protein
MQPCSDTLAHLVPLHAIGYDRMIRSQVSRPVLDLFGRAMKRANDEAVVFAESFVTANVQDHGC